MGGKHQGYVSLADSGVSISNSKKILRIYLGNVNEYYMNIT